MSGLLDELWDQLQAAADGLARVAPRPLFGCNGLFAGTQIFAMVWKDGRIAVRLPDTAAYAECLAQDGAAPWTVGKAGGKRMTMAHWVLVPEELHDDEARLGAWVARAHAMAMAGKAPTKKARPKAAPVKAAKKKPAAARRARAARR